MKHLLCPSMNCANFDCLRDETIALDNAGADIFHMDICDGILAPRLSMGIRDFQSVRRNTKKLIDVHLYMINPMKFIDLFAKEGADIIYVFPESEYFIAAALCRIRELGKSPGLAVGWGCAVETLSGVLPLVDYVMVNTADPVSPKRIFMDTAWATLDKLAAQKDKMNYKILVDGAITPEIIKKAAERSVDGFSMGTQCLFGHEKEVTYEETFTRIRNMIDN